VTPKKVLIVDDNEDVRKLLRLTLDGERYHLLEAANGEQCLTLLAQEKPDIVLLDVMMPGEIDGLMVCSCIKQNPETAGTLVIMISARAQVADIEKGKKAGADFYLTKPFSPLELVGLIESRA
jgi:CheY-like chemotaxis protein